MILLAREKQRDRRQISHTASTMKGFTVPKKKQERENQIAKMKGVKLLIVNPEEYSALATELKEIKT